MATSSGLVLKQYYLGCLAHASYLVGDARAGVAAVVDPQRDVEQYLEDAARLGCRIGHVFLTHFHADFVAGHLELRERTGATIHLGARAQADYPFTAMADGASVRLGAVRLVVLETPGHSPESISILVFAGAATEPHAVLTGDTLFIGDVGRPDLRDASGWSPDTLAGMLYDSLREKLAPLPAATLVYPAHGAGSLCGRSLSTDTVSTIGRQRSDNYALAPMSRERFVELITADLPDAPAYFDYDARLNACERPTLESALARELAPLSLEEALAWVADGAQVLDTREPPAFAAGHLRGSLNIALSGSYATWCGTMLDPRRPVVLIAEPGRERESATRLGRIGFDTVAGFVAGGSDALSARPELVARIERIGARSLAERLCAPAPPLVLDVRTPREWNEGHIDGATNVPLPRLADRMPPADRPLVVLCATGYRSAIAASLLAARGYTALADLAGGMAAWSRLNAAPV